MSSKKAGGSIANETGNILDPAGDECQNFVAQTLDRKGYEFIEKKQVQCCNDT